jgi:hypothetical protein
VLTIDAQPAVKKKKKKKKKKNKKKNILKKKINTLVIKYNPPVNKIVVQCGG